MENILTVENIDQSKYFYSAEKEEDKIIKVRIGYYFNRKNNTPDPENLFIKVVKVKFNSYKDNKIKFKLEDKKNVIELRDDFNSNQRDKILKRTSHGILIMKSILEEMCVEGIINVIKDNVELKLSFKKVEDENSDF